MRPNLVGMLSALIASWVIVQIGQGAWNKYQASIPTVEWKGIDVLTPQVAPGGLLKVVLKAIVRKQCPGEVTRVMIENDQGRVIFRYPVVTSGFQRPTGGLAMAFPYTLRIPEFDDNGEAISTGNYVIRSTAVRYCEEGIDIDNDTPEIRFNIKSTN